jgi:hypothetical protein
VASTAAEETGRVESDEVERESSRDLKSFVMKRNDTGQSIGSKISEAVLNQNCC